MRFIIFVLVVLGVVACSKDQPGPADAQDVAVETPAEVAPEVTTDAEPEATSDSVQDEDAGMQESTPEVEPEEDTGMQDTVDVLPPADVPPDVPAE